MEALLLAYKDCVNGGGLDCCCLRCENCWPRGIKNTALCIVFPCYYIYKNTNSISSYQSDQDELQCFINFLNKKLINTISTFVDFDETKSIVIPNNRDLITGEEAYKNKKKNMRKIKKVFKYEWIANKENVNIELKYEDQLKEEYQIKNVDGKETDKKITIKQLNDKFPKYIKRYIDEDELTEKDLTNDVLISINESKEFYSRTSESKEKNKRIAIKIEEKFEELTESKVDRDKNEDRQCDQIIPLNDFKTPSQILIADKNAKEDEKKEHIISYIPHQRYYTFVHKPNFLKDSSIRIVDTVQYEEIKTVLDYMGKRNCSITIAILRCRKATWENWRDIFKYMSYDPKYHSILLFKKIKLDDKVESKRKCANSICLTLILLIAVAAIMTTIILSLNEIIN